MHKIKSNKKFILSVSFLFFSSTVYADVTAMISSLQGSVQTLLPVSEESPANTGLMQFEGVKYRFTPAKVGQKIRSGERIMTGTDGKAKVIYEHGDVVIVGPSSMLQIPVGAKISRNDPKEMQLTYGKFRAVIDKAGPLSGLKVKTPTAVAGVRGTDFYVSYNPVDEATKVEVVRGQIEVQPVAVTAEQPAESAPKTAVSTGEKLIVPAAAATTTESAPVVQAQVMTVQDIHKLGADSSIDKPSATPAPVKTQVDQAEAKAVALIDQDMHETESSKKVDTANDKALALLQAKAPDASAPAKDAAKQDVKKDEAPEVIVVREALTPISAWSFAFELSLATLNQGNLPCGGSSTCTNSPQPAYQLGVYRGFQLGRTGHWSIKAGLEFADIHGQYSYTDSFGNSETISSQTDMIQIPVMMEYHFTGRWSLFGGLEWSDPLFRSIQISSVAGNLQSVFSGGGGDQSNIFPIIGASMDLTEHFRGGMVFKPDVQRGHEGVSGMNNNQNSQERGPITGVRIEYVL